MILRNLNFKSMPYVRNKRENVTNSLHYDYIIDLIKLTSMENNLDELMTIQSALVNIKMFLSQERKMDPNKLKTLVDEAYDVVMKKIDGAEQLFISKFVMVTM